MTLSLQSHSKRGHYDEIRVLHTPNWLMQKLGCKPHVMEYNGYGPMWWRIDDCISTRCGLWLEYRLTKLMNEYRKHNAP